MKIALGNNDVMRLSNIESLASAFNLTSPWNSFDYGNVHFVALATDHPRTSEGLLDYQGVQYNWLNSDLANTASNNSSQWIIVFFHQNAYGSKTDMTQSLSELSSHFHSLF